MFYQLYELNHAVLGPWRAIADATRLYFKNPLNPVSHTPAGRSMAAALEVFERNTRRYPKPGFGIPSTSVGGVRVPVTEEFVWSQPFCRMIHFKREMAVTGAAERPDPKLLIIAPMSGHYATLLRGTVEGFLPRHEVYITDWQDARLVPLAAGKFDLDDYVQYIMDMLHFLGPNTHVLAVCQPSVPAFAAAALMEEDGDACAPSSLTLMGGPIDTRSSPTAVNNLAQKKGIDWFRRHVIHQVPFPYPGFLRLVYPGFLQLGGFMSMNLDRHVMAQRDFFDHLVKGDGDSAAKHREFYDEYLAVMDLTAEFYLQTVDTVFIRQSLPKGEMMWCGRPVNPASIRNTALLTIEGEKDDITGLGQTEAAQHLAVNLPDDKRYHYVQPDVGHYGVFNGSRFRAEIAPRVTDFIITHDRRPLNAARAQRATAAAAAISAPTVTSAPIPAAVALAAEPEIAAAAVAPVVVAEPVAPAPAIEIAAPIRVDSLAAILLKAPDGDVDNLKRISGIGPKLALKLHALGIFHFHQLAALSPKGIKELEGRIGTRGRAQREDWAGQAHRLMAN